MDPQITREILDDLIPSLEALEAKSTAVLEFLKHEGIANDEKIAPYLEQAASASNVRWLGVRVRIERLLSSVKKESDHKESAEKNIKQAEAAKESNSTEPAKTTAAEAQSEEKSHAAGEEKSAENGDKSKQAARREPGTQAAAGNEDDKGGRDRAGDLEPKSTVSTTEKKVA